MILVDTSVWIDHFRRGSRRLTGQLDDNEVLSHPFVIGELACSSLQKRKKILGLLVALPSAQLAGHDEILRFVDDHKLYGAGLGWIDVHLLGSALLTGCALWTADKALAAAAKKLGISSE